MNVLIVHAHPEPHSFSAALCATATDHLRAQGHQVRVSDLYAAGFNPVASAEDFGSRQNPDYLTYALEQRHWWYVGMLANSLRQLERFLPKRRNLDLLDAGCGTGGAMLQLRRYGRVTGFDFSPIALAFCRRRNLDRTARASVTDVPYADASFDALAAPAPVYPSHSHQAWPSILVINPHTVCDVKEFQTGFSHTLDKICRI